MEEQHERLFDLIASKSFEELNKEEQSFVLKHLREEEYILQQQVIAASAELAYDSVEPLPLPLDETKKPFLKRTIPLYQALIGAACLVLFFIVGNKKSYSLNWRFSTHPVEISLSNGASSVQVIHDTIVKEIPIVTASRIIRDTITVVQQVLQQQNNRLQEVRNPLVYPELTGKLLESKSVPFKEDQTAQFLPSISPENTMK